MVPSLHKQGIKRLGYPLQSDDDIVMSSNVHECKSIALYQCLMQQTIRNKDILSDTM